MIRAKATAVNQLEVVGESMSVAGIAVARVIAAGVVAAGVVAARVLAAGVVAEGLVAAGVVGDDLDPLVALGDERVCKVGFHLLVLWSLIRGRRCILKL